MRRGARALIGATVAAITLAAGLPAASAEAASGWTLQATPLPSQANGGWLSSVSCPASGFCMAANGYGAFSGGYLVPAVEVWNGSGWSAQALPIPSTTNTASIKAVSCASGIRVTGAVRCTAVGTFSSATKKSEALADYWNGHRWAGQPTAAPAYRKSLASVACVSGGGCEAVGQQTLVTSSYDQMLAEGD